MVIRRALTLICDYEGSKFYIMSIDVSDLAVVEVPADVEWAMLVAYHRGRMFYVIDNFFIGNVTDAALVESLSALQLGKQYVAITQKGCDTVRVEAEVELSYLERLFMKEVAEENRAKGVSIANDICKKYRREGLFFDEILDKAKNGGT